MNRTHHRPLIAGGKAAGKRHRRIRAHSTPGQVAGAATNNVGLAAHQFHGLPFALPRSSPSSREPKASRSRRTTPRAAVSSPDNGSAFCARAFKLVLSGLGIAHRRGGYRDPESQAFIESWFGKRKERCVWLHEFETLDEAREVIAAYIDRYHHRPHSGLNYRTPAEVAQTWDDALGDLQTHASCSVNHHGEQASISRIETPRTKCNRRSSAHCSTSTTSTSWLLDDRANLAQDRAGRLP